jgi:hypothetical protein
MKLKIGKYVWNIILVDNLFEALGNTCFKELTIRISKDQTKEMIKDTILHETIHAYIKSYGFNKEYFYEEEIVCFITQNINQITLLSNKIWRTLKNEINKESKNE